MTPCQGRSQAERRFNTAHKKTRSAIERLFGIWKRRFPCLSVGMRFSPQRSATIIVACAVLNNFATLQDDFNLDPDLNDANEAIPMNPDNDDIHDNDVQGQVKRQMIIDNYFQ